MLHGFGHRFFGVLLHSLPSCWPPAIAGFLDRRFLFWAAVGIPSTLIGARLGLVLYGRISDVGFRYVILALLALSGISLIATSL